MWQDVAGLVAGLVAGNVASSVAGLGRRQGVAGDAVVAGFKRHER